MKLHNIAIVALFWINSNKNKQTKQKQKEKIYLSLIKMIQNDLNDGTLTHYKSKLPSYRNQSTDLVGKSIDWFLYEGNTGKECVNRKANFHIIFTKCKYVKNSRTS